jgi:hypothetical protein
MPNPAIDGSTIDRQSRCGITLFDEIPNGAPLQIVQKRRVPRA